MSTLPTTRRGRETRARVLESATAIIRTQGVAATSLGAVEEASGVGRSQLYHYFDDRDDLLRAVIGGTGSMLAGTTTATLGDVTQADSTLDDALTPLDRWFDLALATNFERKGLGGCPLGSLVGQLAEHDDETRQALATAFDGWQAPLERYLRDLASRRILREGIDPAVLADQVMALMQGGLLLSQVRRDPEALRRALAGARQLAAAALG